jgi:hypothetical protein
VSVLFSYDQSTPLIESRIWANATLIPHSKLVQLDWSRLTTQDNLQRWSGFTPK